MWKLFIVYILCIRNFVRYWVYKEKWERSLFLLFYSVIIGIDVYIIIIIIEAYVSVRNFID